MLKAGISVFTLSQEKDFCGWRFAGLEPHLRFWE